MADKVKPSNFLITIEMLRAKNACAGVMAWVEKNLPAGVEYQEFLDALATADKPEWAAWLLANFDSTKEVKTVSSIAVRTKHIFAAGSLVFTCAVNVSGCVQAGGGIRAGEGIAAGGGIKAGTGIEAGWGIAAGGGIKAGTGIRAGWGIEAG